MNGNFPRVRFPYCQTFDLNGRVFNLVNFNLLISVKNNIVLYSRGLCVGCTRIAWPYFSRSNTPRADNSIRANATFVPLTSTRTNPDALPLKFSASSITFVWIIITVSAIGRFAADRRTRLGVV